MTETINSGAPRVDVPPEIARAVLHAMKGMHMLRKDTLNLHGKYKYVSVDQFLAMVGPACTEAGLFVRPVLIAIERVEIEVWDKDTKQMRKRRMARYRYRFRLVHESGATWTDPEDIREVQLDDTGPQTLMAAESYALKGFYRTLLMIPTGEDDADAEAQHDAEIIKATVRAAKKKSETGQAHVMFEIDGAMREVPATDLTSEVMAYMVKLGDTAEAKRWWDANRHGREQFHSEFPKLAHELKRRVEGFFAQPKNGAEPHAVHGSREAV